MTNRGRALGDEKIAGRLTIVRAASEEDADLLVRWHADPDVARYWDDETYTRAEMLERLRRPDVQAFIVEEHSRPIGYLEAWRDGADGGLDMFLVPQARGRGLGPDAARTLASHLLAAGWTRVTVDPYAWNEPAVHAWRRAGFVDVGEREPDDWHTARWLLMEFRP